MTVSPGATSAALAERRALVICAFTARSAASSTAVLAVAAAASASAAAVTPSSAAVVAAVLASPIETGSSSSAPLRACWLIQPLRHRIRVWPCTFCRDSSAATIVPGSSRQTFMVQHQRDGQPLSESTCMPSLWCRTWVEQAHFLGVVLDPQPDDRVLQRPVQPRWDWVTVLSSGASMTQGCGGKGGAGGLPHLKWV